MTDFELAKRLAETMGLDWKETEVRDHRGNYPAVSVRYTTEHGHTLRWAGSRIFDPAASGEDADRVLSWAQDEGWRVMFDVQPGHVACTAVTPTSNGRATRGSARWTTALCLAMVGALAE